MSGGSLSQSISVSELRGMAGGQAQVVDVRSPGEFAAGHIAGAVNIPMDQIEGRIDDLSRTGSIILVCQAGTRARMTAELLSPCHRDIAVLEGGTNAWIREGWPVVRTSKTRWSLERQVRLGAGTLVLAGAVLAFAWDARALFLSAFVGLGLMFAGLTDICLMAEILAKMPWNERSHCGLAGLDSQPHKQVE